MDIHILKVFIEVFIEKSISKAAEKLYISQPTVTEHIKNLEHRLGNKLFFRSGKELKPTEYAIQIYPKILELVNDYNRLIDFLNVKRIKLEKLNIGSSSVPSYLFIPEAIKKFKDKYPECLVNLSISDSNRIIRSVLSYDIILGFVGTKEDHEDLSYIKIMEDEIVLVAREGLFNGEIVEVEQLKQYDMILREDGSGTRKEVEKYLKSGNLNLKNFKIGVILNDLSIFISTIKNSNFYGFMSRIIAQKNGISVHRIKDIFIERSIYAVYRKNIELSEEYIEFINICKSEYIG